MKLLSSYCQTQAVKFANNERTSRQEESRACKLETIILNTFVYSLVRCDSNGKRYMYGDDTASVSAHKELTAADVRAQGN